MPGASRLGDKAQVQQDAHGCPGCPHPGIGPAISGSADVLINGRPAVRVDDVGIHAVCCGPNMWSSAEGSSTVFVNGKPLVRQNDQTRHCGGQGKMIEGSADVIVGGSPSSSGSSGRSGGSDSSNGATSAEGASSGAASAGARSSNAVNAGSAPGGTGGASGSSGAAGNNARAQAPAAANAQASSKDETEEVTFRVQALSLDEKLEGMSVEVELESGNRQTLTTNASGEITVKRRKGESLQVLSIERHEGEKKT